MGESSYNRVSEESVKRYVLYVSERSIQDSLLESTVSSTATANHQNIDSRVLSANDELKVWKEMKPRNGIEISRRSEGSLVRVRGRKIVKASPSQFQQLLTAKSFAKRWDPNVVEGSCLLTLQENLLILRLAFSSDAGPLLKNREFIVYERREMIDDQTYVVAVASLPHEIAEAIAPMKKKLVRGLLQCSWVVEHNRDECTVTCTTQIDPGGWLPKWLTNMLSVKLIRVIDNLWDYPQ